MYTESSQPEKGNYCPVRILPALSALVFEKYIYKQFSEYFIAVFTIFYDCVSASISRKLRIQKQPSRVILNKRCSENIQQIYRKTPMPKCDFDKVVLQPTSSNLPLPPSQ